MIVSAKPANSRRAVATGPPPLMLSCPWRPTSAPHRHREESNEVFSPEIRTSCKNQPAPLVRTGAGRQQLRSRLLGAGFRWLAINLPLAHRADLHGCSCNRPRATNPDEKTSMIEAMTLILSTITLVL